MSIGTRIVAPQGFKQLVANEPYYFLRNHAPSGRVFLVHFAGRGTDEPRARLLTLGGQEFAEQLSPSVQGLIRMDVSPTLPPWLECLDGINFNLIDSCRPLAKQTHKSRVEVREGHIARAVADIELIFEAKNPELELNCYARKCSPIQNEQRFRLWVLTYLVFGRNQWALLPPFHRIGGWDRFAHPDRKFGAHSLYFGEKYGFGVTPEMVEKMWIGYTRFRGPGVSLIEIYRQTIKNIFGCQPITLADGRKHFIHPEGDPFPTHWQFQYWIHKKVDIQEVQETLYGAVRYRSRKAPTQGKFTEAVANLLQRVSADGYYTEERPRGYVDGSLLPPLCVVVGRDELSGKKVGIGFAFGNEHSSAYRMMLFSMAVPKPFFCSLFGLDISEEDWHGQGLPILLGVDRGPGAKKDLIDDFQSRIPIRDLAPSWNGQSKASVESSHPRSVKTEGQPFYVASTLTPVQLAMKEICRLMEFNSNSNVRDRMDIDPALVDLYPSPNELWDHYEQQLRTDAQPTSLSDAVRTFLTLDHIRVDRRGAWYDDIRYDSDEFKDSEFRRKLSSRSGATAKGYVLDLCLRHIWIEVDGFLMMLRMQRPIREIDDFSYISVTEQAERKAALAKVDSGFKQHQQAAAIHFRQIFEKTTGLSWNSGRRKGGRAKSNQRETEEAR